MTLIWISNKYIYCNVQMVYPFILYTVWFVKISFACWMWYTFHQNQSNSFIWSINRFHLKYLKSDGVEGVAREKMNHKKTMNAITGWVTHNHLNWPLNIRTVSNLKLWNVNSIDPTELAYCLATIYVLNTLLLVASRYEIQTNRK